MTSEGLGEMYDDDFVDICTDKFPLVLMEGREDPSSLRRGGARTPNGTSEMLLQFCFRVHCCCSK